MSFWLTLVAVEAVLVVFALLFASWIGQVLGKRRDRNAVRTLVDRVTAQKGQRAEAIRSFLSTHFAFNEEQLEAQSVAVLREELRLYQRFANLYLRRDAGSVSNFQIAFEACVAPYWELKGEVRGVEAPVANQGVVELMPEPDDPELSRLRAEVDYLQRRSDHVSEQLRLAIENLARMLDEYSSLFDGSTVDDLSGAPLIAEAHELIAEADQLGLDVSAATEAQTEARSDSDDRANGSAGVQESVDASVDNSVGESVDALAESASATWPEEDQDEEMEPESVTAGSKVGDESTPQEERTEGHDTPLTEVDDVDLEFEVDEFLADSPDDERIGLEADESESPEPDSPAGAASPAADELMASLDANLPEAPAEPARAPAPSITDAEIDALFDAEPELEMVDSLADQSAQGPVTPFDADERDDETVAIVEKEPTEKVVI